MDGVQLPQGYSHFEEAVYFFPIVPRNSWYSFYRPRRDEWLSRPWSYPAVLNMGPLDWESIALTTRLCSNVPSLSSNNRANIYLFKVNNKNTRKRCEICSKLIIKTAERRRSGVFIVDFKIFHTFF